MNGDITMAEASKLAGVTPQTMRRWVKDIPGAERLVTGEYKIPREALMLYLAQKKSGSKGGPKPGPISGASAFPSPAASHDTFVPAPALVEGGQEFIIQHLKNQVEKLEILLKSKSEAYEKLEKDFYDFKRKSERDEIRYQNKIDEKESEMRKMREEHRADRESQDKSKGILSRWVRDLIPNTKG